MDCWNARDGFVWCSNHRCWRRELKRENGVASKLVFDYIDWTKAEATVTRDDRRESLFGYDKVTSSE